MTIISKEIYELPEEKRFIKISNVPLDKCTNNGKFGKKCDKVAFVLPTYNERENIHLLIPVLEDMMEKNHIDGHIVIVDDNSKDGTAKVAIQFAKAYQNIMVIERPGKMGLGSAYRLGFKHALSLEKDVVFMMDADLSHRPSYIPDFLKTMKKYNSGLVIGSRYVEKGATKGWPMRRKLVSHGANFLGKLIIGSYEVSDMTSGFRAFKAETLDKINYNQLTSNGYAFIGELLYKTKAAKYRIKEIPIVFHERELGKSKLGIDEVKGFIIFLVRTLLHRLRRF
ncbi:MAG: polyprenol monophosphomannose synthase, partial [Candidatus Hodarchaeota archaeon]